MGKESIIGDTSLGKMGRERNNLEKRNANHHEGLYQAAYIIIYIFDSANSLVVDPYEEVCLEDMSWIKM